MVPHACAHAPIVHHERLRENEIAIAESAARDSLKKPVLASGDETRSRWA